MTQKTRVDTAEERLLKTYNEAIPSQCFEKSLPKSIFYWLLDTAVVVGLMVLYSLYFQRTQEKLTLQFASVTAAYWFVTGLFMWSLFVVGHDCGHGSFSESTFVNSVFGHLAHGLILVPFWPWARSHRKHHLFHNNIDKDLSHPWMTDEEFVQLTEKGPLGWLGGLLYKVVTPVFGYAVYLAGIPDGSHFIPVGKLYAGANLADRIGCLFSSAIVVAFGAAGFHLVCARSWLALGMVYLAPVFVFHHWLFLVTYLQHHHEDSQAFTDGAWSYVKGADETVDRRYGFGLDQLTHAITDGHRVHHLFFTKIPHYNLHTATKSLLDKGLIANARQSFFYADFWKTWLGHGYKFTIVHKEGETFNTGIKKKD